MNQIAGGKACNHHLSGRATIFASMIGQTISHYRISAKFGEDGVGVFFKAEDTKLERLVALEFLVEHAVEDSGN